MLKTDSSPLDAAEIRRYGRHLTLPEVGREGQERLKGSSVLVVGLGGLGSPIGLYLAAAGVGRLGLVEFDQVEVTNLQRQVLYGEADLGRAKIDAAMERLHQVNPHIELVPHPERLESSNALDLFAGYDVVVDGSDNFPTRYLVNDACVLTGTPNVYGSIFRFEGQVSVFWGAHGPCYRCLFAEPPPPGLVPSCAEGGVLGVLPGIVGSLQANEVIKLLLGVGEPLIGRLVLFDALKLRFRELELDKNPDCPICSERPTQTGLIDYRAFCGLEEQPAQPAVEAALEITVEELKSSLDNGDAPQIVDVRSPIEWQICRLEGARLLPLHELPQRLEEIDRERALVVHCHSGVRSLQAVRYLRQQGFDRAQNLTGGIDAWSLRIDPSVPRY